MLERLKSHPVPVRAFFRHTLVLTYAVPADDLVTLVPPGLGLDTYQGWGFSAVAFVQTSGLRPAFLPRMCGQDFFLAGFRVFVKYRTQAGRTLRGLRILRSYTNRRLMLVAGNLLTHYQYRLSKVRIELAGTHLHIEMNTPGGEADLQVGADLSLESALPPGSPFPTLREARRFAGPLPFTFDYEPRTPSIILIEGRRANWNPRPVTVDVRRNSFIERLSPKAHLAGAFYLRDVPYQWLRGRRESLQELNHVGSGHA